MNRNSSTDGQSRRRRRLRFISGLAMLLGCLVIGGAWQLRPRNDTSDSKTGFTRAKQLLADGQLELAEVALKSYLERFPDSAEAREELQWLYFNQLRTRDIESFLEGHLTRFPNDFHVAIDLLNCEFRKQLPREGIGYLLEIDRKQPGQASVQLALGYCHWQIGDLDAARTALQLALSLRPGHRETRYIVAEFLLENGEAEAAAAMVAENVDLKNYAMVSAGEQDDDRTWFLRSLIAERQGDDQAALRAIELASAKRPAELRYVHREGLLLQRISQNEEAKQRLKHANELEGCQTELNEIVLSGKHAKPTKELCERLADLLQKSGRDVPSQAWRQLGTRLAASKRSP